MTNCYKYLGLDCKVKFRETAATHFDELYSELFLSKCVCFTKFFVKLAEFFHVYWDVLKQDIEISIPPMVLTKIIIFVTYSSI